MVGGHVLLKEHLAFADVHFPSQVLPAEASLPALATGANTTPELSK